MGSCKNKKLCIICGIRIAELPDRERMGRPIKRICYVCHGSRLKEDINRILESWKLKKEN